jgi:hypothetical protein
VASVDQLEAQARRLLLEYSLTSVIRAGTPSPGGHRRPDSMEPTGMSTHPAELWAVEVQRVRDQHGDLEPVVQALAHELEQVQRRALPDVMHPETGDDLAGLVLERGEGFTPLELSVALRCTSSMVRRWRLAAGCDPERGHPITLTNGNGRPDGVQLVAAGYSIRAAAMLSATPSSTLHDRVRRAR